MKSIFIFVVVGVVVVSAAFLFLNNKKAPSNDATPPSITTKQELKTQDFNFENPKKSAYVVGLSAIIGSLIPLIPFFFLSVSSSITIALVLAALALFITGTIKGKLTKENQFKEELEYIYHFPFTGKEKQKL